MSVLQLGQRVGRPSFCTAACCTSQIFSTLARLHFDPLSQLALVLTYVLLSPVRLFEYRFTAVVIPVLSRHHAVARHEACSITAHARCRQSLRGPRVPSLAWLAARHTWKILGHFECEWLIFLGVTCKAPTDNDCRITLCQLPLPQLFLQHLYEVKTNCHLVPYAQRTPT